MPDGWEVWQLGVVWLLAYGLDALLGEPKRFHPLVGFGQLARRLELLGNSQQSSLHNLLRGLLCWLILVAPPVATVALFGGFLNQSLGVFSLLFDILVLYWAIGWRSMAEHVRPVVAALEQGNAVLAGRRLSMIVSRDTEQSRGEEILSATLETTLENSSDALLASLFWYAVLGPGGVVLHRLANTLDAMWGYRNTRFNHFGRCAARCDDVLNFIPAQITALSFCVLSGRRQSWVSWGCQGWRWKSINAGSVMASGAAALGVTLGGAARYDGKSQDRAHLGEGRAPQAKDVLRALQLVQRVFVLWLAVLLFIGFWI